MVPAFKSTSKLLLKIGLESISESQKKIFEKHSFQDLKDYLITRTNKDWPFLNNHKNIYKLKSITKYTLKHNINRIHCKLEYLELDDNTLLFKFEYGAISLIINLLNRNLDWIKNAILIDKSGTIYPEHYVKKVKNDS